jgi:hypothetical protein
MYQIAQKAKSKGEKGHIDNLWSAFVEHLATDFTHPERMDIFPKCTKLQKAEFQIKSEFSIKNAGYHINLVCDGNPQVTDFLTKRQMYQLTRV